jgi:predicted amidophosphoribosyltransferase
MAEDCLRALSHRRPEYRSGAGTMDRIVATPGFNQAERIATGLAAWVGRTVERRAIVKTRDRAQSTLGSAERARNVAGAMEVGARGVVRGRRVILVDDLVTTGATARRAAALWHAGARDVRVICVGYRPYGCPVRPSAAPFPQS